MLRIDWLILKNTIIQTKTIYSNTNLDLNKTSLWPCRELNAPYAIQQKSQNKEKTRTIYYDQSKVKSRPSNYAI